MTRFARKVKKLLDKILGVFCMITSTCKCKNVSEILMDHDLSSLLLHELIGNLSLNRTHGQVG